MQSGMPIFVKIEDYKAVLEALDLLNKRLDKADEVMRRINDIKNEEDSEMEMWEKELGEIKKKIELMNRTLVDPGM